MAHCYKRILLMMSLAAWLAGCSMVTKRKERTVEHPTPRPTLPADTTSMDTEETPEMAPPEPGQTSIPKIGLIFGPGAALTYAHIGVLQELQKEKIPVASVAGIEWGSVVAALYSHKGLVNEVEWQMMKIKPETMAQRSLIGGAMKPSAASEFSDFFRTAFQRAKAEDARVPFVCGSMNFTKNQVYLMSRGPYEQLLPFCLPYPPLMKLWQGNAAAVRETKVLADHMRARGANFVVFINVLPPAQGRRSVAGPTDSAEGVLWSEAASMYRKRMAGVDHVIHVFSSMDKSLSDFEARREISQKGASNSAVQVRELTKRLGL